MNRHYTLFQDVNNFFTKNPNYLDFSSRLTCSDADDKDLCIAKQTNAFNFVVSSLQEQQTKEMQLDLKYEKMDKFKTIRGDKDRKISMNY